MATKLILFSLLCFGAALARIEEWEWLNTVSPNRKIEDTAFRPGREYHFFYNGQLTTGIPGSSKQHSSNRIQALVTVAMKSQQDVILLLRQIRVGKLNRPVPNPRKMMPFDAFENTPIETHLKLKLELPVKFSYQGGMVRDLEFDSKEDPWSANLKRGVLNMLQVNLQQHRRIESADDARLINRQSGREDMDLPTFYRVTEETLEGECETLYTVQQQPERRYTNRPVLNVTKSINFEKCTKRPLIKYNLRFNAKCPTCDPKYEDNVSDKERLLKSSTVMQYNITGTKQNFLIESAITESQYVFTPFNEESNVIVTYVNQTLVLVKTGPIQQGVEKPQNPIKSDSNMLFTLDWNIAMEKTSMHGQQQIGESYRRVLHDQLKGVNKIETVKKMMQKMTTQMKEQVDEELTKQFSTLIEWMRLCDQQELEQVARIQEQGLSPEEERKVKNIIPQALGVCGTKDCVKVLVQKIMQGQIVPLRGALALKGLLHNRVVSKEIVNEIILLAESEKARENEPLKRASWLIAGSLMNALCAENEDQLALEMKEDPKKFCPREQKDTYVKILFDKLRQATKWQDKVLMLKTIGNAGLDLSIFELEKVIRQQDSVKYPMYVRLEAILALRELRDDMPKKIQRILMPIAMNRREYTGIRSAAAHMILQTHPERPILDQLARNLINEPSHQFASFVYNQLNTYANSTNPCEKQLAYDAKLALRQAKRISTNLGYSQFNHYTFHCPFNKLGFDIDLGTIYSNVSSIPRHMGAVLHMNRMGYWQKYLAGVSLFTEGLEPLMRDLFNGERHGFSNPISNTLSDVFQRHQRRGVPETENEYERELDDLFSKHLKIKHRQYNDEYENEPKAYLSTMFKSQTLFMLPVGKEILQQLAGEYRGSKATEFFDRLQRGWQIDYTTVGQMDDLKVIIPTTLGWKLNLHIEAPVALGVRGRIQASMESTKKMKLQLDLKPSMVATFVCRVEAWSPIAITGVKIQAKAKLFSPIDAKLDVEWIEKAPQIKVIVKPPTQKRDWLVLESRPITYTKSWQQYVRSPDDVSGLEEQTIIGEEVNRVETYNKCYGKSILGIDVCVRGQVRLEPYRDLPKGTPFAPFTGQQKLVVTWQPTESNQDIQIKIDTKMQKLNGNEIHKPMFQIMGHQSQSPFQDPADYSDSSSTSEELDPEERRLLHRPTRRPTRHQLHVRRPGQPDTFQQYRDYQVKKGYKTLVNVELRSGSQKKIDFELAHLYDSMERYGKINFKMIRQQPEQWQVCLDAEMMFPERPQFITEVRDKKILAHAQLRWGPTCNGQSFVQITTQAERSKQQMQWEREKSEYKQYNQEERCRNNKGWCSPLTQEDFVEKIGHMMKYRLDIDYQNVHPVMKNLTNKFYRSLKNYYFWQTDVDQINVQNPEGKIRAEIVLDVETKQRLNVTIKTPKENIMIQDLLLSKPIMPLNQKQSFGDQLSGYMNKEDEDEDRTECSITGKTGWQRRSQVETFDGTKFSAPFTDCWVVLAKDCSSQKPEFVVMAKKSERGEELKEVKIVTRLHRIHLIPDTVEYDSIKVNVNGKPYDPEIDPDILDHGHLVAKVDKVGRTILVELPEAGVEVEFDGYAINVKLSPYYQGQQCGLCGHFDKESADEFRNPDFTEEQDLRQFYMNYLIKDGRCQAPKQLSEVCQSHECDQDKSSSSSSSSSDEDDKDNDETTEKPDYKTKVIEIDDRICFSTIPVPQCDDDSYAYEIKQQKPIPYTCIDQDSHEAEQLERKARYSKKVVPGLTSRQPNFTRNESIPEKCKKYKS